MWSGRCSPHDTADPILIGKLYMSPPTSFLLDLFLSAVWGHYGIGLTSIPFLNLSSLLTWLCFWCVCLPVWEISHQDMNFKMVNLCVWGAEINSRNVQACPICGLSVASSSSAKFPLCPMITNIFHKINLQINLWWRSLARVPGCQEQVSRWSAVTLRLTDVSTDSLLRVRLK